MVRADHRGVDLFDVDFGRAPSRFLTDVRRDAPIYFDENTRLWLVSRYADVRTALVDAESFRPDNVLTAVTRLSWDALRTLARAGFDVPPTLANNGTETHAGLRRCVAHLFTGPRLAASAPTVDRLTDQCLDELQWRLSGGAVVDLGMLAREVPCQVMLTLLGMERLDTTTLSSWTDAALELFWGRPDRARQVELAHGAAELYRWLAEQVRSAHSSAPRGSFLGRLLDHRMPDGRPLRPEELVAVCYFMVIAGQVTTTRMLTSLFLRVLERPDEWARLAVRPERIEPWIEEVLRREPPLTTWRRITSGPAVLGGVSLPAGAELLLLLAGSGSDPEVFAQPDELCPGRPNARRHLAFGVGPHRCLGAEFARMEAGQILRKAVVRLPHLQLVEHHAPPQPPLLSFRSPQRVLAQRSPAAVRLGA